MPSHSLFIPGHAFIDHITVPLRTNCFFPMKPITVSRQR